MNLNEFSKPIKQDLVKFNTYFKEVLNTNVPLLNIIIKYITQKKGKQLRPLLVMLSAKLCGGINERTYKGAAMVELLHTATLVHDDVVDEASERRGLVSINAKWNNKIAVLIGDFLLSKGLIISVEANESLFLGATSKAVKRMSEGELLAIDKSRDFIIDEEVYFRIISDKTASLMAACCEIGAISATSDKTIHNKLELFGEYVGIAFQIRDDILDYTSQSMLIGKPVGNDLKEKKITLPLIYALSKIEKNQSEKIIKNIKKGKISKQEIAEYIKIAIDNGGIEYAESKANFYIDKAKEIVNEFPESDAKNSLLEFSDFVLDRNS